MVLELGVIIGASLLLAIAQSQLNLNPKDYNIHYCTSLTDLHRTCGCTMSHESSYDPICGSDGLTYINECYLECRNSKHNLDITVKNSGVCNTEFQCKCNGVFKPVCASDGNTYSNECTMMCAGDKDNRVTLKHFGECGKLSITSENLDPEEKVDMCPFRSGLRTKCAQTTKRTAVRVPQAGPTKTIQTPAWVPKSDTIQKIRVHSDKAPCVCAAYHGPVCGNNDKTYANFCVLYCVSKVVPDIQLSYWGECENSKRKDPESYDESDPW